MSNLCGICGEAAPVQIIGHWYACEGCGTGAALYGPTAWLDEVARKHARGLRVHGSCQLCGEQTDLNAILCGICDEKTFRRWERL